MLFSQSFLRFSFVTHLTSHVNKHAPLFAHPASVASTVPLHVHQSRHNFHQHPFSPTAFRIYLLTIHCLWSLFSTPCLIASVSAAFFPARHSYPLLSVWYLRSPIFPSIRCLLAPQKLVRSNNWVEDEVEVEWSLIITEESCSASDEEENNISCCNDWI